jgi:hypothetical protein
MNKVRVLILAGLATLVVAGFSQNAKKQAWSGGLETESCIPVVKNPASPAFVARQLDLAGDYNLGNARDRPFESTVGKGSGEPIGSRRPSMQSKS